METDGFHQRSHQGFLKLRLFIEVMKRGIEIAKSSCTDSPVSHSLLLVSLRHDFLTDSIPHAHVQNSRRSVAFVKIFMTALPSLGYNCRDRPNFAVNRMLDRHK